MIKISEAQIHYFCKNMPVNKEIECLHRHYIFSIDSKTKIDCYLYYNNKMINSHNRDFKMIISLLNKGYEPKYYNNFVVINNQTFNGFNKDIIEKYLNNEIDINILEDFEFED